MLNLSKSGGGSAGSLGEGDHSGSEADGPDVPPSPRSPRSAAEDEEDDNISDPEDDDDKDQGIAYFCAVLSIERVREYLITQIGRDESSFQRDEGALCMIYPVTRARI